MRPSVASWAGRVDARPRSSGVFELQHEVRCVTQAMSRCPLISRDPVKRQPASARPRRAVCA
jgi:hypothetical protein